MACVPPYAGINLCLAIDMSGSVCSPNFNSPRLCTNCPATGGTVCNSGGFDRDTCCPNFNDLLGFSTAVINSIDAQTNQASQFSAISFSTGANLVSALGSDAAVAAGAVGAIDYAGGFTNHQAAIQECEATYEGDASGNPPVILLVTDGVATRPDPDPRASGRAAATAATNNGVIIRPVFVNPDPQPADVQYITDLSSDGVVSTVEDFDNLEDVIADIVEAVGCAFFVTDAPTGAPTPEPTPSPTDSPTPEPTDAPTDAPTPCVCDVSQVSGEVQYLEDPPADASHGQLESNDGALLWKERGCVDPGEDVYVSILLDDSDDLPSDLVFATGVATAQNKWSGNLPGGHKYSSYLVHGDKDGRNQEFNFSVEFGCEIRAIVYRNRPGHQELFATDGIFGSPGTVYSQGASQRMFELDGADNFMQVSEDKTTLTVSMVVSHNMDDIRVITDDCGCDSDNIFD